MLWYIVVHILPSSPSNSLPSSLPLFLLPPPLPLSFSLSLFWSPSLPLPPFLSPSLPPSFPHSLSPSLTHTQPWDSSSSEDMSVLSVVGEEGVSPNTEVFYISQQYSLVFVLDMTPTMVQVVSG